MVLNREIELLANGQQVVVDGIHPDTGKPYAWHGGSPAETKRKDLPSISESDACALVEAAVDLLVRDFNYTRASERPKGDKANGHDHAGGPDDWQWLIDNIRAGRQLHDSLRDLAAKLRASGMGAGAAVNFLRGLMEGSSAPHDERWQERYRDIPRLVESAEEKIEQPEKPSLPFIDMSRWDEEPVPEIKWTVPNRIPRRQCCLFSGEGAAGKSTVDLHRSAAHVLGCDWLGVTPERGPAIFIDAEDPVEVIHVRLAAICDYYGVKFADLIKGGLHILSLVGEDAVLATASRSGKIMPTPLYQRMIQAVGDIKPISITVASSANVYSGNEIDRSQVQQFISMLTRLAMLADGSLNLISHPSLSGINTGTGLSGNTQWHNSVRARMYLKGIKAESGVEINAGGLRELEFKKNQYGPLGETFTLRYQRGLFLPVGDTSFDQVAREVRADQVFLDLLRRFTRENRKVSTSTGKNFAPALFAQEKEANGISSKELEAAMRRLFADGKIWNEPCGKPSRPAFRLAVKEGG